MYFCLGRGVFLTEDRPKGAFLLEYAGELVDAEGYKREKIANDDSVYCYIFTEQNKHYWSVANIHTIVENNCIHCGQLFACVV
jgi:hypothetical protein